MWHVPQRNTLYFVLFFVLFFLEEHIVRHSNAFTDGRETICLCSCIVTVGIYNVPIFYNELVWSRLWLAFTPHFEKKDPYAFLNTLFWWKGINCYTLLYRSCLCSEFDQNAMPYYDISKQTIIRCFCERKDCVALEIVCN